LTAEPARLLANDNLKAPLVLVPIGGFDVSRARAHSSEKIRRSRALGGRVEFDRDGFCALDFRQFQLWLGRGAARERRQSDRRGSQ